MMRWNSGDTGFDAKVMKVSESKSDERFAPGALFNHVVETLAVTLTRTGVTSVTVAVAVAILIATVVLGMTTSDAAALGQFCSRC